MGREEIISGHYGTLDVEGGRLETRWGRIEKLTTMHYIGKTLDEIERRTGREPAEIRIMEIGAGTGEYSIELAGSGFDVTAVDLLDLHVRAIADGAEELGIVGNLNALQGDATDISAFPDNGFDLVLCLGPLYHLYADADIDAAISESVRICAPGGHVMFSFLTQDSIMVSYFLRHNCLGEGVESGRIEPGFRPRVHEDEVFCGFFLDEFEERMAKFEDVGKIARAATDGIAPSLREFMDELSEEDFRIWCDYHLATCERVELQGFSNHMLWIGRKRDGS